MKRAILGGLALMAAGVLSLPVFVPLAMLNGEGLASALVLLAGGCVLASPVIALRVANRWRVSELLCSVCLFEVVLAIALASFVAVTEGGQVARHGPPPVALWLISVVFLGGVLFATYMTGLVIPQLLILWIDKTRSWTALTRLVPAVLFVGFVLLLVLGILTSITGFGSP